LPPADRASAVILTSNYGEAGGLDRYGERYGLPGVYSGHNELYYRGRPPETARIVLAVGYPGTGLLGAAFGSCQLVGRLDNGVDIPNEEQEHSIRLCRDPRRPWSQLWPIFQHYD